MHVHSFLFTLFWFKLLYLCCFSVKCETGVGQTLSMFLQTASAIEDLSGGILQGVAAVLSVANMLLDAPQTKSSVRNELKGAPSWNNDCFHLLVVSCWYF